jgi:hypothetical protein
MMIVRSILIPVVFRSIEHGNIFTERANDSNDEEPIAKLRNIKRVE